MPTTPDSLLLSSLKVGAIECESEKEKNQERDCVRVPFHAIRDIYSTFLCLGRDNFSEVSLSALNIHEYTPSRRANVAAQFSLALVLLLIISFIFIFVWL